MKILELRSEKMFILTLQIGTCNESLMGDDFIGYKFIGEESNYWNTLLSNTCPNDLIVTKQLLYDNDIQFIDYNPKIWSL